jgi:hypothetical protein
VWIVTKSVLGVLHGFCVQPILTFTNGDWNINRGSLFPV